MPTEESQTKIMSLNKIIKRGDQFHYNLQIQDELLVRGPFSSEDVARTHWRTEAGIMNSWKTGDAEPPLFEMFQTVSEQLVRIASKYDRCPTCGK